MAVGIPPVPTRRNEGLDELVRCLDGETVEVASPPAAAREVLGILLGMLRSQERGNVRVEV